MAFQAVNILALVKGNETYIFLYDEEGRAEILRFLGQFALNPELSFTWYDAAVLSQKIKQGTTKMEMAEGLSICQRDSSWPWPSDVDDVD